MKRGCLGWRFGRRIFLRQAIVQGRSNSEAWHAHDNLENFASKKHNVPYVQENVFLRVKKTVDIMVGTSSMRWFPADYEAEYLEADKAVTAKKFGK